MTALDGRRRFFSLSLGFLFTFRGTKRWIVSLLREAHSASSWRGSRRGRIRREGNGRRQPSRRETEDLQEREWVHIRTGLHTCILGPQLPQTFEQTLPSFPRPCDSQFMRFALRSMSETSITNRFGPRKIHSCSDFTCYSVKI